MEEHGLALHKVASMGALCLYIKQSMSACGTTKSPEHVENCWHASRIYLHWAYEET